MKRKSFIYFFLSLLLLIGVTIPPFGSIGDVRAASKDPNGGHWCSDSYGWWYEDAAGWYPYNQYLWVDGTEYWFDASGYWA